MCEKCKAIDDKIARYRALGNHINDQQTQDGLARLVRELETQKKALHPDA